MKRIRGYVALAVLMAALVWAVAPAAAQQANAAAARAAIIKDASEKPTPRMADGHPNLTGYWVAPEVPGNDAVHFYYSDNGKTINLGGQDVPKQDEGAQAGFKARAGDLSRRPPYKPEFVAKNRELMFTASNRDPGLVCYPWGVPRIGPPVEIVTTPTTVYFIYVQGGATVANNAFRVIEIGARLPNLEDAKAWKRDEPLDHEALPNGDSTARWEGDTLVVEGVNFDPETWLDGDGDFHSENMRVIERFTRKGNSLEYKVTIDDPDLFTKPWEPVGGLYGHSKMGAQTLVIGPQGQHVVEDYPCIDRDSTHKVNNDRF